MRRRPAKPLVVIGDTVLSIRDHVPALAAEGMGFSVAFPQFSSAANLLPDHRASPVVIALRHDALMPLSGSARDVARVISEVLAFGQPHAQRT
jgi:hypothetical protein